MYCVKMESRLISVILIVLAIKNVNAPNFDQLRGSVTTEEQRAFIKLSVLLESAPKLVAAQLATAVPQSHLSERVVHNWYNYYKDERRTDTRDLPRSGRPRETTTKKQRNCKTAYSEE